MPDELKDMLATPDTNTLPGYTLTPLRVMDMPLLRDRFDATYLAICEKASATMGKRAEAFMDQAHRLIANGLFAEWTPEFKRQILSRGHLPFILWLEIREKHPNISEQFCRTLITRDNWDAVQGAAIELTGAIPVKKNVFQSKDQEKTPPADDSTSKQPSATFGSKTAGPAPSASKPSDA